MHGHSEGSRAERDSDGLSTASRLGAFPPMKNGGAGCPQTRRSAALAALRHELVSHEPS